MRYAKTLKLCAAVLAALAMSSFLSLAGCSSSPKVVATASNTAVSVPSQDTQPLEENSDIAGSVEDVSVTEQEVSDYISQYRTYIGAESDVSFATLLDQAGQTPEDIRKDAIDTLLARKLVSKRAEEKGLSVSSDELDQYIADIKDGLGYATDETGWERTLGTSGYDDEEGYRNDIETKMLLEKLIAADNPDTEATEVQMLVYANKNIGDYTGDYIVEAVFPAGNGAAASNLTSAAQKVDLDEFLSLAQKAVEDGSASQVSETGWTCLADVDNAIIEALDGKSAGDIVMAQADDGTYHVVYIKEMFVPTSVGTVDFANIPDAIRSRLASDASAENRTNLANSYLRDLVNKANVQYADMPSDAPYNVDITLSTYGERDTLSEEELRNSVQEGISAIEAAGE